MTNRKRERYIKKDLGYFTRECMNCSTTEVLNRCSVLINEYTETKNNKIIEDPELYYKIMVVAKRWLVSDYQNLPPDVMDDISHFVSVEIVMKMKRKGLVIENLMAYLRGFLRNITINHIRTLYTTDHSTGKTCSLDDYLVNGGIASEENMIEVGSASHLGTYTKTEKDIMYSLSISKVLVFIIKSLRENLITQKDYWKYVWIVAISFVEGNFNYVNNIKNIRTRIFLKIVITKSSKEYLRLIK